MKSTTHRTIERISVFQYQLILEGIAVGLFTGLLVALFRLVLEKAEELRGTLVDMAHQSFLLVFMALFILVFIVMAVAFCYRKEPLCSGSGIPQVKGELKGQIEADWLQVIIAKFLGASLAIGGGLSLGREGPSIQLGAMVGKGFSRVTKRLRTEEKMLMTCGAGAGLSAAFGAPLAGVVFSLEEMHKNFSTDILLSTMAATVTADFVSSYIFGLKPVFNIALEANLPLSRYWMVILLGLILGFFGVFYNFTIRKVQDLYAKIKNKTVRIAIPFVAVIGLAIWFPSALGSGNWLVDQVSQGNMVIGAIIALLVIKFIFSMVSFGSGAPGGIFLPLLVIGAVTGCLFAKVMGTWIGFEEMYIANFVILGMTGYFSAIVRSPITGVILITEMTGSFDSLLPLAVTALTAYIVADVMRGQPIYDQLLERMLHDKESKREKKVQVAPRSRRGNKIVIESDIYYGSQMDGAVIADMDLPPGALVVSILRDGKEIVPSGSTRLEGGDKLAILCNEAFITIIEERLEKICRTIV